MEELKTMKDFATENILRRFENRIDSAIGKIERIYYQKDDTGKNNVGTQDLSCLVGSLATSLRGFEEICKELKEQEELKRQEIIKWIKKIKEMKYGEKLCLNCKKIYGGGNKPPQYCCRGADGNLSFLEQQTGSSIGAVSILMKLLDIKKKDLKNYLTKKQEDELLEESRENHFETKTIHADAITKISDGDIA